MADNLHAAINLRLALLDLPMADDPAGAEAARLVSPILARQRELSRRVGGGPPGGGPPVQDLPARYKEMLDWLGVKETHVIRHCLSEENPIRESGLLEAVTKLAQRLV